MAFTEEQRRRVAEALHPKLTRCPVCNRAEFSIADDLVLLTLQPDPKVLTLGGRVLPNVAATCTSCGHTLLFNALLLGLGEILGLSAQIEAKK